MTGVLICGHGTKNNEGIASFLALKDEIQQDLSNFQVDHCFIEFAEPFFADAVVNLVNKGCDHIVTIPVMLFDGVHTQEDIPDFISQAKTLFPKVHFELTRCIGIQDTMVQACVKHIKEKIDTEVLSSNPVFVFIGVGSSVTATNELIDDLSKQVADQFSFSQTHVGFMSQVAKPSYRDVITSIVESAKQEQIIVLPYILFPGRYIDMLLEITGRYSNIHNLGCLNQPSLVKNSILNRFNELLITP